MIEYLKYVGNVRLASDVLEKQDGEAEIAKQLSPNLYYPMTLTMFTALLFGNHFPADSLWATDSFSMDQQGWRPCPSLALPAACFPLP